ncbi:formylglycine-generating enzyme family protein [Hoeflea prorocentri]|uniref:SUMF1/EgtB/PvdO family nonheme iron enzyme n=1 Tax=Hoeflea prorocentri TaxID=1922333 RepID=A0A9X3UK57_9HYPH|nr:SUMF1/EgtB/PvdO family nonheme iron enzyme [Hoeflea prorocentri]MCY6380629.1 SUMF1/EgtB/PvdO family nonheme iron enzyme [Hoeflea prorocentri]MDA5398429.1 SUMF1/EgtB/PvdO family nonheme iron enzyme [Hoeflea prorocentri]
MNRRTRHDGIKRAAFFVAAMLLLPLGKVAAESAFAIPQTTEIPAGPFIMGSDATEREMAYRLDEEAYGHSVTRERGWYDHEPRSTIDLPSFQIAKTPITNAQYAVFLEETGHTPPTVSRDVWEGYGLIHPFERAEPYIWNSTAAPGGRESHPVVMVSQRDARAYADWLSKKTGDVWRLPTEAEWEKAARGPQGLYFPWGNDFNAARLNSHDQGPFSTLPVGSYPSGASPYGLLDAAGQVFEWTSTPAGNNRHIVKGGSWDDKGCGVCRPAARHSRPDTIKHILVGFRLAREPS